MNNDDGITTVSFSLAPLPFFNFSTYHYRITAGLGVSVYYHYRRCRIAVPRTIAITGLELSFVPLPLAALPPPVVVLVVWIAPSSG
jgi:hypothetical protein